MIHIDSLRNAMKPRFCPSLLDADGDTALEGCGEDVERIKALELPHQPHESQEPSQLGQAQQHGVDGPEASQDGVDEPRAHRDGIKPVPNVHEEAEPHPHLAL